MTLCVGAEDSHEDFLDDDKKESAGQEDVGEVDHRGGLGAVHWTKPVRQSWWDEEQSIRGSRFPKKVQDAEDKYLRAK